MQLRSFFLCKGLVKTKLFNWINKKIMGKVSVSLKFYFTIAPLRTEIWLPEFS
jgi:hypothetical protein